MKSVDLQKHLLKSNYCSPEDASKLRGLRGFLLTGYWGRIGRVGQGPIKQRQYIDAEPFTLSGELRRSLLFGLFVDELSPPREINVNQRRAKAVVVASDGRLDESMPPSFAFLLYDPVSGEKLEHGDWSMQRS